jgi:hypothetical protein
VAKLGWPEKGQSETDGLRSTLDDGSLSVAEKNGEEQNMMACQNQ